MLCLFFSKMSCECNDVGVDAFGASACVVAVAVSVGGHDEDEEIARSELVNVEVKEVLQGGEGFLGWGTPGGYIRFSGEWRMENGGSRIEDGGYAENCRIQVLESRAKSGSKRRKWKWKRDLVEMEEDMYLEREERRAQEGLLRTRSR